MGRKVARTVHVINEDGLRVQVLPGEELPPLGTYINAAGDVVDFEVTNPKVFEEPEDPFAIAEAEVAATTTPPKTRKGGSVSKKTTAKTTKAKTTKTTRTRAATSRSTAAKKKAAEKSEGE